MRDLRRNLRIISVTRSETYIGFRHMVYRYVWETLAEVS